MTRPLVLALLAALALAACKEKATQNIHAVDMTAETLGHYCQMNLLEHPGPKAQVHLEGAPAPLFFSQVRDAIAYMRAPEQSAPIMAVYVNDMGRAGATWDEPGDGNWIAAADAFYVVGTTREGGMGLPETIPFATDAEAQAMARAEGGEVLRLADIPDAMVLTPTVAIDEADDSDFAARLRALSQTIEEEVR
ncbi:MAG: nitrous oxide reductase accessory protein NosL [Rubellimicrobium sp.]|nr:nitrous oxide reductase accessory protein NosL [Rubellimicrobium sp.]